MVVKLHSVAQWNTGPKKEKLKKGSGKHTAMIYEVQQYALNSSQSNNVNISLCRPAACITTVEQLKYQQKIFISEYILYISLIC